MNDAFEEILVQLSRWSVAFFVFWFFFFFSANKIIYYVLSVRVWRGGGCGRMERQSNVGMANRAEDAFWKKYCGKRRFVKVQDTDIKTDDTYDTTSGVVNCRKLG